MIQPLLPGLHSHIGEIGTTNKVAAFDLDWTLVRSIRGRFPKDADDWAFLPNRVSALKFYREAGYTIAIFTNQGYKGHQLPTMIARINNIIAALNREQLDPWVYAASSPNSTYRKPVPDMWNVFHSSWSAQQAIHPTVDLANSLYVGDAAGRPEDHSADDRGFAHAVELPFYVPEQIFPNNQVVIPDTQTMFIFVGMPGAGKTTYYQQNLQSRGWVHAHQDTLKTQAAMIATVRNALTTGKSVAVDATNPSPDKRREYINLAAQYQVPTLILYFVRNGYEWNKLRPEPVPNVAYNMYYKNLVEPTPALDGVPVVELS